MYDGPHWGSAEQAFASAGAGDEKKKKEKKNEKHRVLRYSVVHGALEGLWREESPPVSVVPLVGMLAAHSVGRPPTESRGTCTVKKDG